MTTTSPKTDDAAVRNAFLEGPFAPVAEERTEVDLQVSGRIPEELEGRLLRAGPNPLDPEDPRTYCWFTGCGMVHGVRLQGGRARWYRNRFVIDDQVVQSRGLHPLPGPSPLGGGPRYVATNVVNTHTFAHAGRTWCFAEAGVLPVELSYELESLRRSDFEGTLNGSWTGHPHRDPSTGELHAIAYYHGWQQKVSHHILDVDGRIRKTLDIPVPGRTVVHDMAITERFAVFLDGPVIFNDELCAEGWAFPYRWEPGYQCRFALIPLEATSADEVRWCEVDQTAIFHILNAYDLPDGRVAFDGVSYDKLFVDDLTGPTESLGRLDRYLLDPATGAAELVRLDDRPQEMPRIDDRRTGRRHRFGYFVAGREENASYLLKQDLERQTSERYDYGRGRVGMEAVFVPTREDAGEDEGWLMAYVTDMTTGSSEVVILASQDLAAGPVARIHLPCRVPVGFHGNWIPDTDLDEVHRNVGPT